MITARDLTGMRMGKLVVEGKVVYKGRFKWQCACDCGGKTWVLAQNFVSGRTKSCGCLINDIVAARSETTIWNHPECTTWRNITRRISPAIHVDPRWRESFRDFLDDVGTRPSSRHRLTRHDPALGYTKDNCYWKAPKSGDHH